MAFTSPQPASAPFEIHDTIPFNYAPNASTIRWVWAASQPVLGNFSCSFEFEVFLPRQRELTRMAPAASDDSHDASRVTEWCALFKASLRCRVCPEAALQ